MSFALSIADEGNVTVIACTGELDAVSAPDLDRAVDDALRASPAGVVLNLGSLTFLDSVGLRSVLSARRRARDTGCPFKVVSPHAPARRVLDLAGLG